MDGAAQDVPDVIEHEVYVAAEAEVVWELVSRPGWWINDHEVDDHPVLATDGAVTTLTHPEWGDFHIETITSERPRHVVFRWLSRPGGDLATDPTTQVELWIDPKPGGVSLRVSETGFATYDDPAAAAAQVENNAEGWQNELRAARNFIAEHR